MKKHVVITLLLVALTSCGTFSPNSVTIDGKTYKTGFYKYYGDDLHPLNIEARDFSTSIHKEGKYHFWKLEGQKYQMYFGENEDSILWNPTLYCLSTELKEAKQYYSDLDNYSYYIGEWDQDETFLKVEDEKYLPAMEQAIKAMVTKPFSRRKKDKIELDSFVRFTLFRESNDNLFTTTRDEFFYSEELGVVYVGSFLLDSGDCVYYTFSKENNELLTELFKIYKESTVIIPDDINPGEGKSSY